MSNRSLAPRMFRAAVCPIRSATTQCSTRIASPLCGSGQRAMSPAAQMPDTLVSRNAFTTTPRSIVSPACSANASRGRTPIPATTRSAGTSIAIAERHRVGADLSRRLAQAKDHTVLLVQRLDERAELRAHHLRASGRSSGATTHTSSPRDRSDAATSSPMKLAPITTARFADFARAMIARESASVRSVNTCGKAAPGMVSRTGSAPVARSSASYSSDGRSAPNSIRRCRASIAETEF